MRKRKSDYNLFISWLAGKRIIFQVILGIFFYLLISYYNLSLWWILGFGSVSGIIWGKVFCRWMCPVGILMEFMMKLSASTSFRSMYQYHKIGCPVAWISGWLNKVSLFKIHLNLDSCRNCGLCDESCYMPSIDNETFSLYKSGKVNPAENFSCSKCLECVAKCPNGSLSYKPVLITGKFKN